MVEWNGFLMISTFLIGKVEVSTKVCVSYQPKFRLLSLHLLSQGTEHVNFCLWNPFPFDLLTSVQSFWVFASPIMLVNARTGRMSSFSSIEEVAGSDHSFHIIGVWWRVLTSYQIRYHIACKWTKLVQFSTLNCALCAPI